MYKIGKTFKFEAAHYLPEHDGKCRNLHGHSYEVEVVVEGAKVVASGPKAGMLVDYGDISKAMKPLIDELDHNGLVQDVIGCESTAENIAAWFFMRLNEVAVGTHSVRVKETASTFAEYVHSIADCEMYYG